jgi:NAD(P)-dependent dehydrogenase (short-subunit alcohol dehydrogenase family)
MARTGTVLVTGAGSVVGADPAAALIRAGYAVRDTASSREQASEARLAIRHCPEGCDHPRCRRGAGTPAEGAPNAPVESHPPRKLAAEPFDR